ncbi:MAG: 4Fe-4S binding protein [Candidatus Aenigmatarchaeota archaeon]
MAVLINFKICDNSEDCSGIEVCPTKAFQWNEKKKTITVDNKRCTSCGLCEKSCPVGAIRMARDEKQARAILKEIEGDSRKVSDLFVDRYGAQPIHTAFLINEKDFETQIIRSTKLAVVELFSHDSIQCMIKSIPVRLLFPNMDIKYRKIENQNLAKLYGIKSLPSLLFFNAGKLIGKIEGYYGENRTEELVRMIRKILLPNKTTG